MSLYVVRYFSLYPADRKYVYKLFDYLEDAKSFVAVYVKDHPTYASKIAMFKQI